MSDERHRNRGGRGALPGPFRATAWGPAGRLGLLLAALAALTGRPAAAHDLWLVPSSFRPATGEPVSVRILVGHDPASAEPLPYRPDWIERFVWAESAAAESGSAASEPEGGAKGEIQGAAGRDPAGWTRFESPGVYALGLVSGATTHSMEVAGFERYLAEEGLTAAARERADAVYADGEVHEAFSRSVKSLVRVGDGRTAGAGDARRLVPVLGPVLGLPLELVPLDDPFHPGARTLRLRVLLHGEPAPGVRVDLSPLDPPAGSGPEASAAGPAHAVSGADGVVTLDLPGDVTRHLAAATVLVAPEAGSPAEWRSLWTSLTFERAADGSTPRGGDALRVQ